MSWGYRILILYLAFISWILFLVYRCVQEDVDLVATDYYAREITYQDKLDRISNTERTGQRLSVAVIKDGRAVEIRYPGQPERTGTISFFKPDNSKLDFDLPVSKVDSTQEIPAEKIAKGAWLVKVEWESGGVRLFQEERIML